MPVELFGISLGRTNKSNNVDLRPSTSTFVCSSFVIPDLDDAYAVDAGGVFGIWY